MSKRNSGPSHSSDEQAVQPNAKRAKQHNFKVGDPVTIRYRWRADVRYDYWAFSRNGRRDGYISAQGRGRTDFEKLPQNWKAEVIEQVVAESRKDWEYRIYHKEKFYWSYDSWGVKLNPVIRFHDIEAVDKNDVDLSSDPSFS